MTRTCPRESEMAQVKKVKNGTKITVPKGTKAAAVMEIIADVFEEAKAVKDKTGKGSYHSRTLVIREEGTGKVYIGKAFATHIGMFVQSMKVELAVTVTRGKAKRG